MAVEVAGCDRLIDREGVTPRDRSHFHTIEENAWADCTDLAILDGVLKLTERCRSVRVEFVTSRARRSDLGYLRWRRWCGCIGGSRCGCVGWCSCGSIRWCS